MPIESYVRFDDGNKMKHKYSHNHQNLKNLITYCMTDECEKRHIPDRIFQTSIICIMIMMIFNVQRIECDLHTIIWPITYPHHKLWSSNGSKNTGFLGSAWNNWQYIKYIMVQSLQTHNHGKLVCYASIVNRVPTKLVMILRWSGIHVDDTYHCLWA